MDHVHGEQNRFPAKLIPCTHTERRSGSSCSICLRVEKLNRNVVDAVEQLSVFLEQVNCQYDPLQRLPVELAISIFLYLPRPPSLDVFDVTFTAKKHHALRPVPFLLGSVCRYWRRIVWSTPQFWNVLWLYVRACDPMGVARGRMLSEWLDRSGQLPLYVCMFMPDNTTHEHHLSSYDSQSVAWKSTNETINALYRYIPQIRVLHLSLAGPQIERFGRKLGIAKPDDSNLILERLFIDVELREWSWEFPGKCYKFSLEAGTPSPTHLSFREIDFQDIHIHWEHIINLEASQISLQSALRLLRLAPQMQHFKFNIPSDDYYHEVHPSHSSDIIHHSLTSLICDGDSGKFLHFITCPALEKLSYGPGSVDLHTFLDRSACGLKDLTLGTRAYVNNQMDTLLATLRRTPLLTRLSFNHCTEHFDDFSSFLARFYPKLQPLLPHLRFFQVSCSPTLFRHFRWSDIPLMIPPAPQLSDSNEQVVWQPLHQLEVTFTNDSSSSEDGAHVIDRENLLRIMGLVRDGVEIEIKDREGLDLITLSQEIHNLN